MTEQGKPLSEFDIKPGDRFKCVGWEDNWRSSIGKEYTATLDHDKNHDGVIILSSCGSWFRDKSLMQTGQCALFIRLDDPKQYVTINDKSGHGTYHKTKAALTEYASGSNHKFRVFELGKELEFTKEIVWKD